jgi:hypothetical protein
LEHQDLPYVVVVPNQTDHARLTPEVSTTPFGFIGADVIVTDIFLATFARSASPLRYLSHHSLASLFLTVCFSCDCGNA